MPRPHQYRFARLHLMGAVNDRRSYVREVLQDRVTIERLPFRYTFIDARTISLDNEGFIFGRLAKYRVSDEVEVLDEVNRQIRDNTLENSVVASPAFCLHLESWMLAYRPVSGHLPDRQFRSIFEELIEKKHEGFFVQATIEVISDRITVYEAIEKMRMINSLEVRLHPSNPTNDPIWAGIDGRIKDMNAHEYQQSLDAPSGESLNKNALKKEDIYLQGIPMAADGYGSAAVSGELDGQQRTVSTEGSPVTVAVDDLEQEPESIVQQLLRMFRRLWDRKNNGA